VTTYQRTRDDGVVPVMPLRRHGKGPDRAAVVGALLVVLVGVAVVKPWQPGGEDHRVAVVPAASLADAFPPASAALPNPRADGRGAATANARLGLPALGWKDVGKLDAAPGAWGVRVIVARPDRLPGDRPPGSDETVVDGWFLSQRWAPAAPISLGLPSASFDFRLDPRPLGREGVLVPTDRQVVAALGVTTPGDDVPLDVRIWRLRGNALPERLPVRELPGREPAGQRLFLAPSSPTRPRDHWSPGFYRIDLLMGDRISQVRVLLPGRPEPEPWRAKYTLAFTDLGSRFPELPPGPFIVDQAGIPHHLAAVASEPLDERGAWLNAEWRPGPGSGRLVARVASDGVVAIGFKLAPSPAAHIVKAVLHRLAPDGGPDPIAPMIGSRSYWGEPPLRTRIAWAVSARDHELIWSSGLYRMDLEWADPSGHHRSSWHLDLVPAEAPLVEPPFLAAVRDWADYAKRPGVVIGTARQDEGGPRYARIRWYRQGPGTVKPVPEQLGASCRGAPLLDGGQRLIGIAHVSVGTPAVVVLRAFVGGQRLRKPVASAANAVRGLVVIGSADGRAWQPGVYEVALSEPLSWTVDGEASERPADKDRFVFCVGAFAWGGLSVPGSAVSSEAYRIASTATSAWAPLDQVQGLPIGMAEPMFPR
jgi:hypothetical protein